MFLWVFLSAIYRRINCDVDLHLNVYSIIQWVRNIDKGGKRSPQGGCDAPLPQRSFTSLLPPHLHMLLCLPSVVGSWSRTSALFWSSNWANVSLSCFSWVFVIVIKKLNWWCTPLVPGQAPKPPPPPKKKERKNFTAYESSLSVRDKTFISCLYQMEKSRIFCWIHWQY